MAGAARLAQARPEWQDFTRKPATVGPCKMKIVGLRLLFRQQCSDHLAYHLRCQFRVFHGKQMATRHLAEKLADQLARGLQARLTTLHRFRAADKADGNWKPILDEAADVMRQAAVDIRFHFTRKTQLHPVRMGDQATVYV